MVRQCDSKRKENIRGVAFGWRLGRLTLEGKPDRGLLHNRAMALNVNRALKDGACRCKFKVRIMRRLMVIWIADLDVG